MKKIFIILGFLFTINSFGQDFNKYTFVVVPEKFSFLKETDQYQLNPLTKFLFEKKGFEAFLEGEEEFIESNHDRCEGLYADVLSDSGMFRTRLKVVLKDCKNRQVFVSKEGVSREKEYRIAYQEALRKAFESITSANFPPAEVIVRGTPDLNNNSAVKNNQGKITTSSKAMQENNPKEISTEVQDASHSKQEIVSTSEKSFKKNFLREGKTFFLQKSDNGFNVFHKGTSDPFASLIRSSAGNSFIYNSVTSKGIACFDNEGNLIIEILKEDGNSLETIVYRPGNQ